MSNEKIMSVLDRPNSYVGKTVPRPNAKRLVQGRGTFVDDIELPRMVHLAFQRSPYAHANIVSIDSEDARAVPGVVGNLQSLFTKFEEITRTHQMEKIKTIGDEFMAAAGLTVQNFQPLISAVKCGLDMAEATKGLDNGWEVRVGVHAGPVVAGIVGDEKYQFDVWGNTVNTAARMTGPGDPGKVVMTYDSWLQVQDECEGRSLGQVDVKGKGQVEIVECYGLQ
ncbi:MAG: hypothetical protein HOL37_06315 [Rhodospirillaceae bacterium]|nr:hypothetical protein [Rhodospirillaceae bacterium]